jgi:ATP-dependent DNA helicase RecG
MRYDLETSISRLPDIKEEVIQNLRHLNIQTIGDLLYHFPHRYDDFSVFKKIEELKPGETVTVRGKIDKLKTSRTWKKRMSITECLVSDQTGSIKVIWFNFPRPVSFLSDGKYIQISGKVAINKKNEFYFQHPNFQIISQKQFESNSPTDELGSSASTGNLIPVYPETKGINSYLLRRIIKKVLTLIEIKEFIPEDISRSQKLIDLASALKQIHFPSSFSQAQEARKRFAFEKMFLIQIKAIQTKKNWENNSAICIPFNETLIKKFVSSLPFALTDAQRRAAWQIIKDLEKEVPMNRLLEGDVGAGKTIVATMAILSVINEGHQCALLAPTEVLAVQHYYSISKILKNHNFSGALLTASQKIANNKKISDKKILDKISVGNVKLVVGTHALLQEKIRFKNLVLVIIDEQHRFGVNQRAYLQQKTLNLDDGIKSKIPHLLTMTATPIPRTLSLAIFGNLDLSVIDEFPKGRKKIITKTVSDKERDEIYQFVRNEIKKGRQAFVICPLVEESSKISQVKAVTEEQKRLQKKIFSDLKIGLLHGKMKSKEKEAVMQEFKNKEFDILVSTSVVEVGIDVPNATIMIIEGAERFGLSQLHQFRGRVGRGQYQSYCFLITSVNAPKVTSRLRTMEKTNDGFKISQEDLKLRGPGQFLGTMQSGMADITMESLSDIKTIQAARLEAQRVLSFDPHLEKFPLLKQQIQKLQSTAHWE